MSMGDLQDPKMEVPYHIFGHILWGYSLKFRPFIGLIYGRYLQFRYLKWPLNMFYSFFGGFLSKSKIRREELGREDMGYRSGTHRDGVQWRFFTHKI
jgi:hypothetical protein